MYRSGHNEVHSKCIYQETDTGVRIPPSPPKNVFKITVIGCSEQIKGEKMSIVKSFDGNMIDVGDCMGCAKAQAKEDTKINSGKILRTKNFDVSQDFELPINGFIVIGSLRHIESINEMTVDEKQELIILIDIVISSLKKINVCSQYNVVWEEKDGNHFHVWLVPRHSYLRDIIGTNIMKKIGELFDYAKKNLRTDENINEIYTTIKKLQEELKNNKTIQELL